MKTLFDKNNKVWIAAPDQSIHSGDQSLGQLVYRRLLEFPNKVIQIDDDSKQQVTSHQALTWGVRIALHLEKLQFNHSDIVGISARNSSYILPIVLGCLFNGTPLHAVNAMLDKDTLSYCLSLTKPIIIFCDSNNYEVLKRATDTYKPMFYTIATNISNVPTVLDLLKETENEELYLPQGTAMGDNQTVAILCSSGTTGKPKAACLPSSVFLAKDWINTKDSITYVSSGIDWITGMYFLITNCIIGYTRIISSKGFEPEHFLELVEKYKISTVFLSSRYLASLTNHPSTTNERLKFLKFLSFGGSPLSKATCEKFLQLCGKRIELHASYGTTEMGLIAHTNGLEKIKSVGHLANSLTMAIHNENGHHLLHNQVGEIVIKGPSAWNGYFNNRSETEKSLDANGWFHTGDLGYMDDDNEIFIVDRKKEILKYQGMQYWPREIEEVITELEGVQDVCVVSILLENLGDIAGALVVLGEGSKLAEQDIVNHVRARLISEHKCLNAGAYFVEKLPQNLNGKILKKNSQDLLRKLFYENSKKQLVGISR
ncbi:putative 4-coumarate--CoA ligase 1 [Haematobia irritans]|uniref:putative 4-coumarate--CoA ligase 1 n=1 Tax=Haematobia irritans TaxID=7368 RepID=UPI003F507AB1